MEVFNMTRTHPYLARLAHWLFTISILVLGASGIEIFAAFPSFGSKLPEPLELPVPELLALGGWLGGALSWHFTFAWFFAASLALYAVELARGGWRRIWLTKSEWSGIWPMVRYYLLRGPKPHIAELYNPLQKLAYLSMTAALFGAFSTGVTLAQPVQADALVRTLGGWQNVRIAHFTCLLAFAGFLPGHLLMVALAGRTAMVAMLTGRMPTSSLADPRTLGR
jgi:thiosulfate reductase cytochrome b subunit